MKPKNLYFYEYKKCQKHHLTDACMVEIVCSNSEGIRYRCRANGDFLNDKHLPHDIYGYAQLKEASTGCSEEIMRKPKKLYRYDLNKTLRVHPITIDCVPMAYGRQPFGGILWRCREGLHDFFGYDQKKVAKEEELFAIRSRIKLEILWRKYLKGK